MPQLQSNLIILCFDGLGAPWLGPYGNTWYDTPNWNRLGAESLLFEFAYAEGPHLGDNYRGYWESLAFPSGARTALISDHETIFQLPHADRFDDPIHVQGEECTESAESLDATGVGLTLGAAAHWLSEAREPFALWVHASAIRGPWDAPYSLRLETVDEEAGDPDPPDFVAPPNTTLEGDYDPDELLGYMQAHAGQMMAIDAALGQLLDVIDHLPALGESMVVATSPRAFPLGEHRIVGGTGALFVETLHIPFLVRLPDRRFAAQRSSWLMQPHELPTLIERLFDSSRLKTADELETLFGFQGALPDCRQVAISADGDRLSIRTPGWFLTENESGTPKLFAKPDDRWEVNEVADLCPDALAELQALLEEYRVAQRDGAPFQPSLSELLREGYD